MSFARRRFDADDTFAVAVRLARVVAGLAQADLAARADLPLAAIVSIEQGTRLASVGEAANLAHALDTTIDYMAVGPSGPLIKAKPGRPKRASLTPMRPR
jgi:transcriptional regulator with XRE-family HTH domain